jgi:hypothetical protein
MHDQSPWVAKRRGGNSTDGAASRQCSLVEKGGGTPTHLGSPCGCVCAQQAVKDDISCTEHLPFPLFIFGGEVIGSPPRPFQLKLQSVSASTGQKGHPVGKNYPDGARNLGGVDTTHTRIVSSSSVLTT